MTREEAIDWLARLKSNTVNHTLDMPLWWNEPLAEALEKAIKALEQEPKWIPISERLPEKEGLYLVSVKNEHDRRYSKTCWFHGDDNWFARQDVIAWMPLPEPYVPKINVGGMEESEDKE